MLPTVIPKPWGRFEEFILNEKSTVKILFVAQGEEFSLQYHNHREEYWRVLIGTPEITIGEVISRAKPGDEFDVPPHILHRISAIQGNVEVLEISLGEFSEEDIVRIKDKYNRP